jgi:hypothetical protein
MPGPWFRCESADEAFLETAPMRLRGVFEVPRPAAEVWGELTSDRPLHWCRILSDVSWTSPRPFGVGTTRTVKALRGASVLKERYFRWEEGSRHSFEVLETTNPMIRRLAEDYLVEPISDSASRFTWLIAVEPRALARPANPLNRRLLVTLFTDTDRHFAAA